MDKGDDKERKEPENELQQLLEYTRVNVTLRTHLFQEKIISREENDMLSSLMTNQQQKKAAVLLYEILAGRINGYNALAVALKESNQSKAYSILTEIWPKAKENSDLESFNEHTPLLNISTEVVPRCTERVFGLIAVVMIIFLAVFGIGIALLKLKDLVSDYR